MKTYYLHIMTKHAAAYQVQESTSRDPMVKELGQTQNLSVLRQIEKRQTITTVMMMELEARGAKMWGDYCRDIEMEGEPRRMYAAKCSFCNVLGMDGISADNR